MDEAVRPVEKVNSQKKSKKGKGKKIAIVLFIFLFLGGASYAAVYFNLFGAKAYVDGLASKLPFMKKSKNSSQNIDLQKFYEQKIYDLESQNRVLEEKLKSEQAANINLQKQLMDVTTRLNDLITQKSNTQNKAKEFSSYIQNMDAKKAAKLVETLIDTNVDMANEVLKSLSSEFTSEILSNISADKTIKLLGVSNKTNNGSSINVSVLVDIYKNMDAKVAAAIFESMISDTKKYNLVLNILKNLDSKTSSQIISNMTADNAAKVTQDLSALK